MRFTGGAEMRCPRCQQDNPPQAKFCLECGKRLESEASAEPRFASPDIYTPRYLAEKILTSRAALEGERKHVTVLFCDIVGSTALAQRLGPEGMHELLNRFFDLALAEVHRYEGTVNQFLGDGFMALFGAPLAHEDHAQRAVLTAAEVRRRLIQELGAELAVRMGLHTGVVVVGAIGDDLRMDYTAVGDTTHLAARLQQLAEPGTIVLSDATYRLVETLVEANLLGRQEIRGLGPQLVHRVERLAPAAPRFDAALRSELTPLVGRRAELERLERCYDEAAAGAVRGVNIVGEAGIGKSRLLYEFRQRCPEDKVAVLRGACSTWGGAVPFRPFVEVVRNAFGLGAGDTTGEIERKLRRGLEALGLDTDPALPFLLNLLGLDPDPKAFQGLDGEIIGARTREVLQTLLREQARRSPVVLAIDDAHWIDSPSEGLIRRIVETSEQLPLLVLCAHRPGYRLPWAGLPQVTEIRLDPLSEDHAVDLVRHRLGGREMSAHVARLVVERAEGNPLFAEELSRYLLESGALRGEGAEGRVGAEAARMPAKLQDLVMARVDRLSDGPRALLQVASVVGRRFRLDVVADAAQVDGHLTQYVRDLEAQELIFRQERDGSDEYRFRHVLIQEAVYASLLTARREQMHERVAEAIERHYSDRVGEWAEALAHQWSQTRRVDKAVQYMALAGEKSLRLYSVEEAHERFRRVVQLVEAHPGCADDRFLADVLLAWCRSYYYLKDVPNFIALSRYLPRVEALGDRRRLSLFLFWIGFAHVFPPFPDKARPTSASATRAWD